MIKNKSFLIFSSFCHLLSLIYVVCLLHQFNQEELITMTFAKSQVQITTDHAIIG